MRTGETPERSRAGAMRLVTFQLEDRSYALHLEHVDSIQRMVAVSVVPASPPWLAGVIDLRGTVVPVINLRQRLGLTSRRARLTDRLLIVSHDGRTMALVVDEVREVLEVTRRELETSAEVLSPAVSAVVRRDANELLLVLSIEEIAPPANVGGGGGRGA